MIEINNKTRSKIDQALVKRIIFQFLRQYKKSGRDISIAFVGDSVMRHLNKTYRGLDRPTDILSFAGEEGALGELIIDYAQIKRQAKQYSDNRPRKELIFILVHGLFHLLGYDDNTEASRLKMIKMGEGFIRKLKI